MSLEAEARARRQRRIQRGAVVTTYTLGVPIGLTNTVDWRVTLRPPTSPNLIWSDNFSDILTDSGVASSPSVRSSILSAASPDVEAYHSLSGLPLSPVPEEDETSEVLQETISSYNDGREATLSPEEMLEGTQSRHSTPNPTSPNTKNRKRQP